MLMFDALSIHDRGNATYDPGATLISPNNPSSGSNNVKTTRVALDASHYLRMNSIQWACAPGGPTSSNTNGSVWSFHMPTAQTNLSSWLGTHTGTTPTAYYLDTQCNLLNPYKVCTDLWGYRGLGGSAPLPDITQAAFQRAKGLCRDYWWMMADAFTAAKALHPTRPVGLYLSPPDSQNYQRYYAEINSGSQRSNYPSAMRWAQRGQDFMSQFVGYLDFIGLGAYCFYSGSRASWVGTQQNLWNNITQRDVRWARQYGLPIIPFVCPSGHSSRSNWATTTVDSAIIQDCLDFLQDSMGVFGVIMWDNSNGRSTINATKYNTDGHWAVMDKYAGGGAKKKTVTSHNSTGILFNNGVWGI